MKARSVGVRWHDRRTLAFVIGAAAHRGIPAPRTSLLQTNPILAAPAERSPALADRRISAGFIVEAATGTTDPFAPAAYRLLDNLPVISTDQNSAAGTPIMRRPQAERLGGRRECGNGQEDNDQIEPQEVSGYYFASLVPNGAAARGGKVASAASDASGIDKTLTSPSSAKTRRESDS